MHLDTKIREYPFANKSSASLLICCGGFESRSRAFARKLRKNNCAFQEVLLLRYLPAQEENEKSYDWLKARLTSLSGKVPRTVNFETGKPQQGFLQIKNAVEKVSEDIGVKTAVVDITGMSHLVAICAVHSCLILGFRTKIAYTEAKEYFPLKRVSRKLIRAWREHDYPAANEFLQSAALKSVDILPEFQGNFRPGRPVCLMIFAGYEPNRMEGLVNIYAPGALIVLYGKSPYRRLLWRTRLSRELHQELFGGWLYRPVDISTLDIDKILRTLEREVGIIKDRYDVAITPHCSKMQAIATYIFWRRHPEVQIVFTSPVRFHPKRYSRGSGKTFLHDLRSQELLGRAATKSTL